MEAHAASFIHEKGSHSIHSKNTWEDFERRLVMHYTEKIKSMGDMLDKMQF